MTSRMLCLQLAGFRIGQLAEEIGRDDGHQQSADMPRRVLNQGPGPYTVVVELAPVGRAELSPEDDRLGSRRCLFGLLRGEFLVCQLRPVVGQCEIIHFEYFAKAAFSNELEAAELRFRYGHEVHERQPGGGCGDTPRSVRSRVLTDAPSLCWCSSMGHRCTRGAARPSPRSLDVVDVHHEFCRAWRLPGTCRPSTELSASERRSVGEPAAASRHRMRVPPHWVWQRGGRLEVCQKYPARRTGRRRDVRDRLGA